MLEVAGDGNDSSATVRLGFGFRAGRERKREHASVRGERGRWRTASASLSPRHELGDGRDWRRRSTAAVATRRSFQSDENDGNFPITP